MGTGQEQKAAPPLFWKLCVLCLVSGFLSTPFSYFFSGILKLPLYLDTIFNVAVAFSAGLVPGLLAIFFNYLFNFFQYKQLMSLPLNEVWTMYIFSICMIAEVVLVCAFHKGIKNQESTFLNKPSLNSFAGTASLLLVLVAIDCIVISVLGGLIDVARTVLSSSRLYWPEDNLKLGLLRNNMSLLWAAILSRIPINIVDRLVVIFGGYGISILYRKWLKAEPWSA
ncbi:hypothetical protein LJC14_00310 [Treponema sp. OttesenSCG-928-L16]|nr:hypothetical protein [Treponema sp. OttesenSCG-928-L16]